MKQQLLTVGVIGKSLKENEKRVAIHPEHIQLIPEEFRKQISFEKGYGALFGMDDQTIADMTSGRIASREEILRDFDCIIMPKPLEEDLIKVKQGTIIWGWSHCVQHSKITQIAIDRKLTLIAWAEMFKWNKSDNKIRHTFYKNNEIAGHAGLNHALSLRGLSGSYGKPLKAAILSFGSVSRGAIYALLGQGVTDITVYTKRLATEISEQIPGVVFKQMRNNQEGHLLFIEADGSTHPFSEALSDVQIIVNGTLQDTEQPLMFIPEEESESLEEGTLIVDISCDAGMGFWCAKPTTFEHPMLNIDGKFYYAVDHSPSYYWNAASWEISEAILPFLPIVMKGKEAWEKDKTISKAIEIKQGIILDPKIISFQNRDSKPPYVLL